MFNDSINYLKDSDDAAKTVLIGGLLAIFGFLIIPALIVEGYVIRVLRRGSAGDTEAPVFSDWGTLTVDGLKAAIITLVYFLVPAILAAVFVGGGAALANDAPFIGGVVALFGGLLTLIATLAVWYVVPAALVRFAENGAMGSGFDYESLAPIVRDREYATGWLLALGVIVVAGVIVSVVAVVPLVGWLVAVFLGFYAQVTAAYIYARSYAEATDHQLREGPEVDDGRPAV
ncbi:DUF4013 domain-containing protein [Haladaptatus pallidirubidus]|uniref:DUF4013 domain-containing protein n=1 Tax=Haladaptatus pallidirubidus TaxID=1008152 RepID=A0AAV3UDV8_9EURY|nr:DUF4013 domain-containing protein [Haladaptatus pallidirubidus]